MSESLQANVAVATYNMSYVSDKLDDLRKMQFASEAAFLSSNPALFDLITSNEKKEVRPEIRRQYWNNASELLLRFFEMHQNQGLTCVVGLQEMNKTEPGELLTGSAAIDDMLEFFNADMKTKYIQVCDSVIVTKIDKKTNVATEEILALSIIYDQNVFGAVKNKEIWDNEKKGRPTLMVVTQNNYVFISTHGTNAKLDTTQDPSTLLTNFNTEIVKNNKTKVENEINKRLSELQLNSFNVSDIFVMGDLNDRFDAIKEFNIAKKKLIYNGDAPRSCCYNWDSSCSEKRYRQLEPTKDLGYCDDTGIEKTNPQTGIKNPMNDKEGFIENYRYRGDKVFGATPVGAIQIFDAENRKGKSVESDHELVFATFRYEDDLFPDAEKLGGRRRRVLKGRSRRSASRRSASRRSASRRSASRRSASRRSASRSRKTKGGRRKAGKKKTYKRRR
jgi:hypothetical protein